MKYCNNEVRIGDYVYFYDVGRHYETKCKYKVIAVKKIEGVIIGITVEVKNNGTDKSYIKGWFTNGTIEQKHYNLPMNIRAWNVGFWYKASRGIEIE